IFQKQMRVPFAYAIYADFESLTTKIESASPDPTKSSTEKYQHHQACGFAYVIVSERPDYCKAPVLYRGEDAVDKFLESLQKEEQRIETLLEDIVPMQLTPLEEDRFQRATLCHICKNELGADRVRDHCHVTRKFRGAAHNACNLNFQFTGHIPIILHNLRGYDSHLIMQGLGKIKNKPINCIPNNIEKYISFSIGNLDFIDSLQFMNASLEKLVCNLAKEGDKKYSILKNTPRPAKLSEYEVADFDVMEVADASEDGFILEVNLEYPQELHDQHSDYPLAPETMKVTSDMLSPYCQQLNEELDLVGAPVTKLVPNLCNKTHYILHYRNLKLYMEMGMKLTKVHLILGFAQSTWLKSYVDFNTEKRKHATNDFEKDFFKLMNNSVFGKTMENLRKRVNVKLITNPTKLIKLTASPAFDSFRIFSEDLAAVNMKKTKLYLNRPIYVGFSILDLSKVLMYNFHFKYMVRKYGTQSKLLFTDTDSLCYDVKTDDLYRDYHQDLDYFDTSEYPTDHVHFHYCARNKKVLGKMKDETHGIPIQEFIGLRPKMYSILFTENNKQVEKKTAKGISKNVTKRMIRHQDYKS
ncbi:hypothetical protein QZH41_009380, partial [Actinostola sp. cb2023]